METVILKTDGTPVRLEDYFIHKEFDVDGFLIGFDYVDQNAKLIKYRYYQIGDFKLADRKEENLSGYYVESDFLTYIQSIGYAYVNSIEVLQKGSKYNFNNHLASVGDPIQIVKVDFSAPYNHYYKQIKYQFNIESTLGSTEIRKYKKKIEENFRFLGYEIPIPDVATSTIDEENLMNTPTGYFYSKNFGDVVDSWTVSSTYKDYFKKMTTLIAFKVFYIVRDLFPKILTQAEMLKVDNAADNTNPDISYLTDLEQVLFTLKKNWGFYYNPSASPDLVHRHSFDPIFNLTPEYEQYGYYFRGVVAFYDGLYSVQDRLVLMAPDKRLGYLLQILSVNALIAIPFNVILNTLRDFVKRDGIYEYQEQFIVRLVISIQPSYADRFLDFLLGKENGINTNFEALYSLLDDARLERITIVNWFVDEQTNRKYFAYAVNKLWTISKYNISYIPAGTTAVFGDINPNAYFIEHPEELKLESVLTFSSITDSSGYATTDTKIYFESSFKGKTIKIDELKETVRYSGVNTVGTTSISSRIEVKEFGSFHLYHPVTLIGYQPHQDLQTDPPNLVVPQQTVVPAFLFHFIEEYDRLADFDAAISLAVDLTVEVLITYFTGGLSALKNIGYLRHTTKLGQALRGALPTTESVLVWRGLEAASESVTVLASTLVLIQDYLIAEENDLTKRAYKQKVQKIFLSLLFGGAAGAIASRVKAVEDANFILRNIDGSPPSIPSIPQSVHGITDEILDLLRDLVGKKQVTLSVFASRLNSLDLNSGINHIWAKYILLTDEQKLKFLKDFGSLDDVKDIEQWRRLNKGTNGSYLDNWLNLSEAGIAEANYIDFVTSNHRVSSILRYYQETSLRNVIEGLSYKDKIKFLDDFGNAEADFFNRLEVNPYLVKDWSNLNGERKLFAKQYPWVWIEEAIVAARFRKLYIRPSSLYNKITNSEILAKFGQRGVDLVNEVENKVSQTRLLFVKNNPLRERTLVSGMIDKETGEMSDLFFNYLKEETAFGGDYHNWINNYGPNEPYLHPNMRLRYDQTNFVRNNGYGYNMNNREDIVFTGDFMAAHAEVRALNHLACKKFGNNLVETADFDNWIKNNVLGYNSYLVKDGIQHTCADCFYLTDLVTYIK
ncbi:hypothetical protein [Pedobacter glucosidilyticus]|uniref:hypothetical protein n=1 Tax=Pedobacter glucosidilyticus TaxID=1122941 RepID=UPI00040823A8|nr:hypothetical protein [Pedobacter glucosidilyticus]